MRAAAFTLFALAVMLNSYAGVLAAQRGWWLMVPAAAAAYLASAYFCYRCLRLPPDPGPGRLPVRKSRNGNVR